MTLSIKIPAGLSKWTDLVGPDGRHDLFSVAANAVQILVRDHLSGEAMKRHFTARSLGATPTYILQKAARGTTFNATSEYGEVVIPSPAVARAFGDVTITPTRAAALTLPVDKASYGRRVKELQMLGWMIFRLKGKDVLMGYEKDMTKKDGQKTAIPLYVLKRRVTQRQDRTLLPSDAAIGTAAARAMVNEIKRVAEKAA